MTPNDYQQAALRTAPGDLPPEKLLLNGLMGLNGEAGEAIDILKKHLFQGHELDTAHMAKELGDVAWYLAVSANAIGYGSPAYRCILPDECSEYIRFLLLRHQTSAISSLPVISSE